MKKSRMLVAMLCAVLMVGVLTVPAYAGGGDEGGEYVPWVGLEPVESLPVEQPPDPKPFTPEGTGTVLDNATDEDGKEFFTITTADEAVFLPCDRPAAGRGECVFSQRRHRLRSAGPGGAWAGAGGPAPCGGART